MARSKKALNEEKARRALEKSIDSLAHCRGSIATALLDQRLSKKVRAQLKQLDGWLERAMSLLEWEQYFDTVRKFSVTRILAVSAYTLLGAVGLAADVAGLKEVFEDSANVIHEQCEVVESVGTSSGEDWMGSSGASRQATHGGTVSPAGSLKVERIPGRGRPKEHAATASGVSSTAGLATGQGTAHDATVDIKAKAGAQAQTVVATPGVLHLEAVPGTVRVGTATEADEALPTTPIVGTADITLGAVVSTASGTSGQAPAVTPVDGIANPGSIALKATLPPTTASGGEIAPPAATGSTGTIHAPTVALEVDDLTSAVTRDHVKLSDDEDDDSSTLT